MSLEGYKKIEDLVHRKTTVAEGMKTLIRFCEQTHPKTNWKPFSQLPLENDFKQLTVWLNRLLSKEPPPKNINGFWFGLFNPILNDGQPTCCLYLAGSTRFDLTEDDPDWACSPEYWPKGRYSDSEVLTTIYRAMSDPEVEGGGTGEYTLCLGYASLVVSAWCQSDLRSKLLGIAALRGVTVGFDSGDGILIDVLKQ